MTPTRRGSWPQWFQDTFDLAVRRACRLAQLSRTAWYRPSRAKDQSALRLRIRELAHARPRFGYLRIWVLLRREGWRGETMPQACSFCHRPSPPASHPA